MIYLDHAATSIPRSPAVQGAIAMALEMASPGRGRHGPQEAARAAVEDARAAVAALGGRGVVCFTPGATFGLNQAILGWRPRPRRIGLDPLVHNAARRPAVASGVPLFSLPGDANGRVDLDADWPADLDLLVITHGSNVTGLVQPVDDILERARSVGAAVIVDAAQTAGLTPLPRADAVAFSGHKGLAASPGIGALVVDPARGLEPLVRGGVGFDSQADDVPDDLPARLESGTVNLPGVLAMGAAARSLPSWDWREAGRALRDALAAAGLTSVGGGELPVASVRVPGWEPRTLEELLDRVYGIVTRAGLHCAPAAHAMIGTAEGGGTLRVSSGRGTSKVELDALTRALREVLPGGMKKVSVAP